MPYPVIVSVDPALTNRNRRTTAFRFILAIPHLLLVGGVGIGAAWKRSDLSLGSETGLLGAAAFLLAIVSWFTIMIGGRHVPGIRQFTSFYMRWRVRALAYLMLLRDEYPPFGDAEYPASIQIVDPAGPRDRLTVGLRILLGIPHFIAIVCLVLVWWITSFIGWLMILFTEEYPQELYVFGVGVLRWLLRVEAYVLLLVDEYPPFSLR
jgi:Domain of unknown function (DUF4389)